MAKADVHRQVSLGSGAIDQGPIICVMWSVTAQTLSVVISNVARRMDVASLVSLCRSAQTQALQMADPPPSC